MNENQILDIFKNSEALLEGHFLLSSGLHSDKYFQCAKVLQYPEYSILLCNILSNKLDPESFNLIVSPALGGILVGYELGRQLNKRNIFTERENNEMKLRRGFQIQPEDNVLICEDVITTLKSSNEVRKVVEEYGAKVTGYACLVDRSNDLVSENNKITSVIKIPITTFEPDICPLCKTGIPVIKPGSRKI